jgi:nucleotidyltransferase substrate binding protein (TIGR01987 family)
VSEPEKDVRWKQRFQNYRRAFNLLRTALTEKEIDEYSALEQEGIARRIRYTIELGWKTFKDYIEFCGVALAEVTPRAVIKECATVGTFSEAGIDGNIFLDMIFARSALLHTYDIGRFTDIMAKIKSDYLPELEKEYVFFVNKEPNLKKEFSRCP